MCSFTAKAIMNNDTVIGEGIGMSKQKAKEESAKVAIEYLANTHGMPALLLMHDLLSRQFTSSNSESIPPPQLATLLLPGAAQPQPSITLPVPAATMEEEKGKDNSPLKEGVIDYVSRLSYLANEKKVKLHWDFREEDFNFVAEVTYKNEKAEGRGKKKKIAKNEAAKAMLRGLARTKRELRARRLSSIQREVDVRRSTPPPQPPPPKNSVNTQHFMNWCENFGRKQQQETGAIYIEERDPPGVLDIIDARHEGELAGQARTMRATREQRAKVELIVRCLNEWKPAFVGILIGTGSFELETMRSSCLEIDVWCEIRCAVEEQFRRMLEISDRWVSCNKEKRLFERFDVNLQKNEVRIAIDGKYIVIVRGVLCANEDQFWDNERVKITVNHFKWMTAFLAEKQGDELPVVETLMMLREQRKAANLTDIPIEIVDISFVKMMAFMKSRGVVPTLGQALEGTYRELIKFVADPHETAGDWYAYPEYLPALQRTINKSVRYEKMAAIIDVMKSFTL